MVPNNRILIVGGLGWLGHQIAGALADRDGVQLRLLVRKDTTDRLKRSRLDVLKSRGATIALGHLSDKPSLESAREGIDTIISAVQGGPDTILVGQRNLLEAAERAAVSRSRMIPSDFAADISRLDYEDNYNLGLRKQFAGSLAASRVAPTSVYCGGFLDVMFSPRFPLVDWQKGIIRFWGDGNQPLDYTAIADVAAFTAAAATDWSMAGRPLRIAGDSLTMLQMRSILQDVSGRSLEARSLVNLGRALEPD